MAVSKCSRCGGVMFEVVEAKVKGMNFSCYFVQCAKCGSVFGIQEYNNISAMIYELSENVRMTLLDIQHNLKTINDHLGMMEGLATERGEDSIPAAKDD